MYCINCGVKLSNTEKVCPLCQTVVFHPEIALETAKKAYPACTPRERADTKALQSLLTMLWLLPAVLVFLCDWQIHGCVTWSGYVIGALGISYAAMILPLWFRKRNPVIFTPCTFAAIALYLLYINWQTGGSWFLSFAFPVTGGICVIVTAVVTLMRYVPKANLFIFGGATILLGAYMLLVEFLLNQTFHFPKFIGWSLYPLTVLTLVGGALLYLAISRPARELFERKFFI